jgi:hypothetical protein
MSMKTHVDYLVLNAMFRGRVLGKGVDYKGDDLINAINLLMDSQLNTLVGGGGNCGRWKA